MQWTTITVISAALLAGGACAWFGWQLWRTLKSASKAGRAASALIGAHTDAVLKRQAEIAERIEPITRKSDQLMSDGADLAADAAALQKILSKPGIERKRMYRRIADALLPDEEESDAITRVGAIDIGSNTVRLLVADVPATDPPGQPRRITEKMSICRLAKGVNQSGVLATDRMDLVISTVREFQAAAKSAGAKRVLATATSAVRDAENGDDFLERVRNELGIETRLLSGKVEAQTSWNGATSDPDIRMLASSGTVLMIDIGGGSTEIIVAEDGKVKNSHSFQLGSVRMTEKFNLADVSGLQLNQQLSTAKAYSRRKFTNTFNELTRDGAVGNAIGVAGTVTTAITIRDEVSKWDRTKVHKQTLQHSDLKAVIRKLAAVTVDERKSIAGLEPDRAEVILGGLVILDAFFDAFGPKEFVVSCSDILDGIAIMTAQHEGTN